MSDDLQDYTVRLQESFHRLKQLHGLQGQAMGESREALIGVLQYLILGIAAYEALAERIQADLALLSDRVAQLEQQRKVGE